VGEVFDRVMGAVVTCGVGDMNEALVAAAASGGGLAGVGGCAPPGRSGGLTSLILPLAFVSGRGTFVSARNL